MQDGRAPRVKNRAPAAVQITAEQLLREAQERQETQFKAPKQRVEDYEELHEYRGRKRKEFEERIRRTRGSLKEWTSYASWEASQGEFDRSRSVYERALDVDARSVQLWLSYTEMELKARNVQHARNLFDRAVTLLPRIDQLWYKYVYLEELLQNVPGARQVFERWMKWEPDDKAWQAYIKMEERYNELDRASAIYERWVGVRPDPRVWVKWGKFEEDRQRPDKAREIFNAALEFFGDDEEQIEKGQAVFAAFARMETRLKEFERARIIYKFALSRLPRTKSSTLYAAYTKFEKQHGTRSTLESTVLGKRRIQYDEEVTHDPRNYDVWFDYARLEESARRAAIEDGEDDVAVDAATGRVREVYERAVAQVPPGQEKRHWRRYIFLWLDYALFEEIETKDYERTRQIYQTALKVVPHKSFTFAKLWLLFARFEVRRLRLPEARKVLGAGIGLCAKPKLFQGYIDLEVELREFDRVRTLYEKYLEYDATNAPAWIKFAELETTLQDLPRTRAIYELALSQPQGLSMPELLWKSYIDFEVDEGERERARALYERLVERSGHWKVWVSYALFEAAPIRAAQVEEEENVEEDEENVPMEPGDPVRARVIFERGYKALKEETTRANDRNLDEERQDVLLAWKSFEEENGTEEDVLKVQALMPTPKKVRRQIDEYNQEEVWEMVFPDDLRESNPSTFKFLQMAQAWKSKGSILFPPAAAAAPEPARGLNEDRDEDDAASSTGDVEMEGGQGDGH
ncbi:protein prenylyltransferase [Hysterangium stoloniferum]|nr:protein prenylyltransferase [Hysterangium stoloniferum]